MILNCNLSKLLFCCAKIMHMPSCNHSIYTWECNTKECLPFLIKTHCKDICCFGSYNIVLVFAAPRLLVFLGADPTVATLGSGYLRIIFAGTFVLGSLALGWFVSPYWFLFTAFVGLNLFQSAFTRWCLMEDILAKVGVAQKPA